MQFFVVYIAEAHALDSRAPMGGSGAPLVQEPVTIEERQGIVSQCVTALKIAHIPTLVDMMDDRANKAYAAWPDRLFLIGKDGKVAYAGGPGPFGFKPDELAEAIDGELKKGKAGGAP